MKVEIADTLDAPSASDADKFLKLLGGDVDVFTFQTFDDRKGVSKDTSLVTVRTGTFEQLEAPFRKMQEHGAGIFVAVQPMSGARKAENVTGIRAIFGDFDSGLPTSSFPLPPSMVVESSPGKYQCYWLVADWHLDDEGKQAFNAVERCLVNEHGADKNAVDLARVLRVPGFLHQKNPDAPFMVKLVDATGQRYTRAEVEKAFSSGDKRQPTQRVSTSAIYDNVLSSNLNWTTVLNQLSVISPDDYDAWIQVGMALRHEAGERGFLIWKAWSSTSHKCQERELRSKWDSFKGTRSNPITMGTVGMLSKRALTREPTSEEAEKRKQRFNEMDVTLSRAQSLNKSAKGLQASFGTVADAAVAHSDAGTEGRVLWSTLKANGQPCGRCQKNIETALDHLNIRLWKNTFTGRQHVEGFERFDEMTEEALNALWLRVHALVKTPDEFFRSVIREIARRDERHPVLEKLLALPQWDGTPRLAKLFTHYAGANKDEKLLAWLGRAFAIAMVRRLRTPGTKWDVMPVLEGPQGAGKSTFLKTLGGEWYEDGLTLGADPKIVIEQTANKWVVEISELSGMSGREIETIKGMVTRTHDTARPAYARAPVSVPRQFVMTGTTNDRQYLKDSTGNRRFIPVEVGEMQLDGLKTDRDQILAEALLAEATGESIAMPKDLYGTARELQESRTITSPIFDRLQEVIGDECGLLDMPTIMEILTERVGIEERKPKFDALFSQQLGRAMAKLGFEHDRQRIGGGKRQVVYSKPNADGQAPKLRFIKGSTFGGRGQPDQVAPLDDEPFPEENSKVVHVPAAVWQQN